MLVASLLLASLVLTLAILAGVAIVWGTAERPPPIESLTSAIEQMPKLKFPDPVRFPSRDGTSLVYREYPVADAGQVAVLLHGSIHDSRMMHGIGAFLATQGIAAYSMDVRGHGGSGPRGDIGFIGHLEADIVDLVAHIRTTRADARLALIGHSAGGGLALRFAGGQDQHLFDRYVALAPFIEHRGALARRDGPNWAAVAAARFIALQLLHTVRIRLFQQLPVLLCAVPAESSCTATYSFRLAVNFRADLNWRRNIRAIKAKTMVLIGEEDELFDGRAYPAVIEPLNKNVHVQVLKAADHTSICRKTSAIMAVRKALV